MAANQDKVHLYWGWRTPHLLRGLTTGVSLCGVRGVINQQLTAVPKYSTCRECRDLYRTLYKQTDEGKPKC